MSVWKHGVAKRCGCATAPRCDCYPYIRAQYKGDRQMGPVDRFAFLLEPNQPLPRTLTDAKPMVARLKDWIVRGKPAPKTTTATAALIMNTVIDAWKKWRDRQHAGRPVGRRDSLASKIASAKAYFGEMDPASIDEKVLGAFVAEYLAKGRSIATPNGIIRSVVRPAILWGLGQTVPLWTGQSPFGQYRFAIDTDAETKRERRCAPDEEAELLDACAILNDAAYDYCGQYLGDFIQIAIDLCPRSEEILSLTNGDVDWQLHQLTFRRTKRGEVRKVPFNPKGRVAAILNRRRFAGKAAPVIAQPNGDRVLRLDRAWMHSVCLASGMPYELTSRRGRPSRETLAGYKAVNLRMHDLRHEASTWWAWCGVKDEDREFLNGHMSQSMEGRYSHDKLERARKALAELVWPRESERAVAAKRKAGAR